MCFSCGRRDIPLLRDYIADHERATDLGAQLSTALHRDDIPAARRLPADVAAELDSHRSGEEGGLFQVMRGDEGYREYVDSLVMKHDELRRRGRAVPRLADRAVG